MSTEAVPQNPQAVVNIPQTQTQTQTPGQGQPANVPVKTSADTAAKGDNADLDDGELKKPRGTDHYMHFLICVFCPWWLLIWIAMCARDIYRGTCCDDSM